MEDMLITLIIPAYNEERVIGDTLKEISGYIKGRSLSCEVIVVDDGSSDKTLERARLSAGLFDDFKVLVNSSNMGKGYSVRRAMLAAKGEYILFMDADNSTSVYEFEKFLPFLKERYDVIIASRRLKESLVDEPQPLLRAKMGKFYILLSKVILGLNLSDLNCGFKAFKAETARKLFTAQKMNDWSFDAEILFLASKMGFRIKEVPVRWIHKSGSKVRPLRDAFRSFVSIFKIRFNSL